MSTIGTSDVAAGGANANDENRGIFTRPSVILAIGADIAFGLICGWNTFVDTPFHFLINVLCSVAFIVAGVLLKEDQTKRFLGWCLLGCGVMWSAQWLGSWNSGPFPILGIYANALVYVCGGFAIIFYPPGRKVPRTERALAALSLVMLVDRIPLILSSRPSWNGFQDRSWWPSPFANHSLFHDVYMMVYVFECALAAAFAYMMWMRVRRMTGIDHIVTTPIAVGFVVAALFSALTSTSQLFPHARINTYYMTLSLVVVGVPIGFVISTLRVRLQHASVADSLHRSFAEQAPSIEVVRDALRDTLRDPTLDVLYWAPEVSTYVDAAGRHVDIPSATEGQTVRLASTRSGEPLAIVVADSSFDRHAGVLEIAVNASAMALEIARLQAIVRSQLEEVRQSRTRIAEAGLEERRRIERDLHDGVQQRLLAVAARLGAAKRQTTDLEARGAMTVIGEELRASLESLRDLAHGIHPPELRQFGLAAAMEVVAERSPVPVRFSVTNQRFPGVVEATAYFVVCEALTNVVKHAAASHVDVNVCHTDNTLVIEIADDGVGGSDETKGSGLTGLRDRVQAAGGQLTHCPGNAGGTIVRAEVPCV